MKFYIGEDCASGIVAEDKAKFFGYLDDEIERDREMNCDYFEVTITRSWDTQIPDSTKEDYVDETIVAFDDLTEDRGDYYD